MPVPTLFSCYTMAAIIQKLKLWLCYVLTCTFSFCYAMRSPYSCGGLIRSSSFFVVFRFIKCKIRFGVHESFEIKNKQGLWSSSFLGSQYFLLCMNTCFTCICFFKYSYILLCNRTKLSLHPHFIPYCDLKTILLPKVSLLFVYLHEMKLQVRFGEGGSNF